MADYFYEYLDLISAIKEKIGKKKIIIPDGGIIIDINEVDKNMSLYRNNSEIDLFSLCWFFNHDYAWVFLWKDITNTKENAGYSDIFRKLDYDDSYTFVCNEIHIQKDSKGIKRLYKKIKFYKYDFCEKWKCINKKECPISPVNCKFYQYALKHRIGYKKEISPASRDWVNI